uniref:Uncharacterized protein n=1 Tax=Escherichia coli TaxID=562 RepID=A0A6G9HIQ1_ECOLX|nr:hypothetical protein [Escherichia coli]
MFVQHRNNQLVLDVLIFELHIFKRQLNLKVPFTSPPTQTLDAIVTSRSGSS